MDYLIPKKYNRFSQAGRSLHWCSGNETLEITPWGPDGLRVRASMQGVLDDLPGALLPDQPNGPDTAAMDLADNEANIRNGSIQAKITYEGRVTFLNINNGATLLAEKPVNPQQTARLFKPHPGSSTYQLSVSFEPQEGERLYGLGQHQHGMLNQKECVVDQMQVNMEVCIPFLLSSRGYGFLWNNPALGRVELAENGMRWTADVTRQMDYFITTGSTPTQILDRYTAAVGRSPMLPEWAAGFWQSRLRYASQEQVLEVGREYHRRGLPLDVLVIDAGYWHEMGSYCFDPRFWPDPKGMVRELAEMGIRVMVSVWPAINRVSPAYSVMKEHGFLTRSERGNPVHITHLPDLRPHDGPSLLTLYDPTHPDARRYFWEIIEKGVFSDGVKLFWLDACEPELVPPDHDAIRYHLGSGLEVGMLYPLMHQRAIFEGLKNTGEREIITLSRSAWAGSQRYGAAVWSGDIPSTFESLRRQIPAGLNIGLSGIPWWTTDIGGFAGGDTTDAGFRELIVRWFQYGVFCPIFRLHGFRSPIPENWMNGGSENEVWSFGEPAYTIICGLLHLRERLKPYIMEQMRLASSTGLPVMRPLFLDHPEDVAAWTVEDAFLFGPDLLVAPVYIAGQHQRSVYLPEGTVWEDAWTGEVHSGGKVVQAQAPLEHIPVFWRAGSKWKFRFR